MLSEQEISALQDVAPSLLSEAKTASPENKAFVFSMELESHLLPGLRIRMPPSPDDNPPPFPLDLFVGIPLAELKALAHADAAERQKLVAHFGATFSPRLLRAIQHFDAHTVNYEAGFQSEPGTTSVILEDSV